MAESRGPITLITSISDQRNRWKDLAYAWKRVALQSTDAWSECGAPALWRNVERSVFWCEAHWKSADSEQTLRADKVPWHAGLLQALDLEDEL